MRLSTWEAECKRHRKTLTDLAATEWHEPEPNDRDQLPDDWQAYIAELEQFANGWIETANRELESTK